jgi:alkanesulfonate monooxygenase SsuD/methylene tetrahydromethanopterin reductase-like flavin-dependent oxidoreductase (luciferase family)
VLCGPLRLPALTAKMAETLQRLSNGRLILGLGAGSSDQEMHSFGIDPPTAGAKVTGLEESVRIIQALWTEPAVTFAGRLHRVNDARIEPKPDQPIPVWLGAFGDRALDLTGRLADGWIPSYGYAPPQVVVVMRDKVLAAAETAGRDPGAVTCAYHLEARVGTAVPSSEVVSGSVAQVTDQLIALVALGFTAFSVSLVGPGRHDQAAALAHEVMPAVRAAV